MKVDIVVKVGVQTMKKAKKPNPPAKAAFLNVDLDIESTAKLDLLVTEMGDAVSVLYCGVYGRPRRNHLHLETSRYYRAPDVTIHALCGIVERLSPAGRQVWDAAVGKEFNVGYDLRPTERCSSFSLRTRTLQRISSLGATLGVTYYRGVTGGEQKPA